MEIEAQKKLLKLYNEGYAIHISNGYVAEMVYEIAECGDTGEIVYSDNVFSDCPLRKISESDVEVFTQIDDWEAADL